MSTTQFWKDQYKDAFELYKKEMANNRELFDLSIKMHTRCAVYAYTGFWSSIVAFVIGYILGGLK